MGHSEIKVIKWLSGYETCFLLKVGITSPMSVGLKQPVDGKGVPQGASGILWRETGDAEREACLPRRAACL